MHRTQLLRVLAALAFSMLGGCASVGPNSIKLGRNYYNEVIHQTSGDQLLLNLVRIKNNEMPLFIDVSEVDAAVTVTANVSGGTANIGANRGTTGGTLAGQTSNVAGSATYSESPTIRYQPLQGNALIAQLNSPIAVDSIVDLFDSDWPPEHIFPLIVDRLTPRAADYDEAVLDLVALHNNKELFIEATHETQSPQSNKANTTSQSGQTGNQKNNTIKLYLTRGGAPNSDFKCAIGLEPAEVERDSLRRWFSLRKVSNTDIKTLTIAKINSASLAELRKIYDGLVRNHQATLQIHGGSYEKPDAFPALRTRSALGVMKHLIESDHARFVSPDEATRLMNLPQNLPSQGCNRPGNHFISKYSYVDKIDGAPTAIFMLIQHSDFPPTNAFVSIYENGEYYFIANNDEVSKRTFSFLTLISSIQAIPSTAAALTPSISVGGK